MAYNNKLAGAKAQSKNGGVATDYPGTQNYYKYSDGKTVTLTGQYEAYSTNEGVDYYCLATNGDWIILSYDYNGNYLYPSQISYGWNVTDINSDGASRPENVRGAQDVLNKLVRINKRILENNLICRRFAKYLNSNERELLNMLQANLENRNEELTNSGTLRDVKVASPDQLTQYGTSRYDISGVLTTIIVSALVVTAVSGAAYWFYKGLLEEAENDVKYSDELTEKLLKKLTPEEYEQLKRETAGMLTREKLASRFKGGLSATKILLFAALALFAIPLLKKTKNEITKKQSNGRK